MTLLLSVHLTPESLVISIIVDCIWNGNAGAHGGIGIANRAVGSSLERREGNSGNSWWWSGTKTNGKSVRSRQASSRQTDFVQCSLQERRQVVNTWLTALLCHVEAVDPVALSESLQMDENYELHLCTFATSCHTSQEDLWSTRWSQTASEKGSKSGTHW